tara:strand:- start:234 stop:611 length:378 start_codon:yes stop_codon:yes gene_type:complete
MKPNEERLNLIEMVTSVTVKLCEERFFEMVVFNKSQRRKMRILLRRSILDYFKNIFTEEELNKLTEIDIRLLEKFICSMTTAMDSEEFLDFVTKVVSDKFSDNFPDVKDILKDLLGPEGPDLDSD